MKTRPIIAIFLLLAPLVAFSFFLLNKNKQKFALNADKKKADNVRYFKAIKVHNDSLTLYIEGQGRVSSARKIDISSEVQGMLLSGSKTLKPGTKFSQGEVLFQIRDNEARLSLQSRKSTYLNLIAGALADIKLDFPDNFENWKKFFDDIDITKALPELPAVKSSKEKTFIASKNIFGEYYGIRSDEERLKKYVFTAPFSGSITEVFMEPGSIVNPGVKLASIIQANELEVEIPVDARIIHKVQTGKTADLSTTGGDKKFKGRVIRVGDFVATSTQSVPVYVAIESGDMNSLYNGMYLHARIETDVCPSCVEIPRRAVINDHEYYMIKDSSLKIGELTIEAVYEQNIAVSGVKDKTILVTEPVNQVNDSIKTAPILAQ